MLIRPLRDKKASSVASSLLEIFANFGIPKKIQSDRGKEFDNEVILQICENFKIDQIFSTPYNPSQNGIVERQIGTVSNMIKKTTISKFNDISKWPDILPIIQFAINCRFSKAHSFQPFTIMFGRNPIFNGEEKVNEENSLLEHWLQIYGNLFPKCEEKLNLSQSKMKKVVDSKRKLTKPGDFKLGDIVYFKNNQRTSKWDPEYIGPGRVISINNRTGNFTISDPEDKEAILINNAPLQSLVLSYPRGVLRQRNNG